FDSSDLAGWRSVSGDWTGNDGYAASTSPSGLLVSQKSGTADYRVEADLRTSSGPAGVVFGYRSSRNYAVAWLDPQRGVLRVEQRSGGKLVSTTERPLYQGFRYDTWHSVTVEVRNGRAAVQVAPSI